MLNLLHYDMNDGEGRGGKGEGMGGVSEEIKGRESKREKVRIKWEEMKTKLQFCKKLKLCDYYSIYYQNNQPLSPTNTKSYKK